MTERITNYIESVFRDVPASERATITKNEIKQNIIDRYNDLIAEGKNEEEAYAVAVSGAGDLSGIVSDLKSEVVTRVPAPAPAPASAKQEAKKAEEKKQAKEESAETRRENATLRLFHTILWPVTVVTYLMISMLTGFMWSYSWLIFIAAVVASNIFTFIICKSRPVKRRHALGALIWTATVLTYFMLSFATGRWAITWMVFPLGIAVRGIVFAAVYRNDADIDSNDSENNDE